MGMGLERFTTIGFIYPRFARLCRQAGVAPSRVARLAKVSPSTLTRWRRTKKLRHNSAVKLCRVLRVPVEAIRTNGKAKP